MLNLNNTEEEYSNLDAVQAYSDVAKETRKFDQEESITDKDALKSILEDDLTYRKIKEKDDEDSYGPQIAAGFGGTAAVGVFGGVLAFAGVGVPPFAIFILVALAVASAIVGIIYTSKESNRKNKLKEAADQRNEKILAMNKKRNIDMDKSLPTSSINNQDIQAKKKKEEQKELIQLTESISSDALRESLLLANISPKLKDPAKNIASGAAEGLYDQNRREVAATGPQYTRENVNQEQKGKGQGNV